MTDDRGRVELENPRHDNANPDATSTSAAACDDDRASSTAFSEGAVSVSAKGDPNRVPAAHASSVSAIDFMAHSPYDTPGSAVRLLHPGSDCQENKTGRHDDKNIPYEESTATCSSQHQHPHQQEQQPAQQQQKSFYPLQSSSNDTGLPIVQVQTAEHHQFNTGPVDHATGLPIAALSNLHRLLRKKDSSNPNNSASTHHRPSPSITADLVVNAAARSSSREGGGSTSVSSFGRMGGAISPAEGGGQAQSHQQQPHFTQFRGIYDTARRLDATDFGSVETNNNLLQHIKREGDGIHSTDGTANMPNSTGPYSNVIQSNKLSLPQILDPTTSLLLSPPNNDNHSDKNPPQQDYSTDPALTSSNIIMNHDKLEIQKLQTSISAYQIKINTLENKLEQKELERLAYITRVEGLTQQLDLEIDCKKKLQSKINFIRRHQKDHSPSSYNNLDDKYIHRQQSLESDPHITTSEYDCHQTSSWSSSPRPTPDTATNNNSVYLDYIKRLESELAKEKTDAREAFLQREDELLAKIDKHTFKFNKKMEPLIRENIELTKSNALLIAQMRSSALAGAVGAFHSQNGNGNGIPPSETLHALQNSLPEEEKLVITPATTAVELADHVIHHLKSKLYRERRQSQHVYLEREDEMLLEQKKLAEGHERAILSQNIRIESLQGVLLENGISFDGPVTATFDFSGEGGLPNKRMREI